MKEFIKKYGHIWVMIYFVYYISNFRRLEQTVTTNFYNIHTALDDIIPFNEFFIIPYLMWFGFIAATIMYFFFKDKEEYYKLFFFLATGMTLSIIICDIFPNGTDLRVLADPNKNFCSSLVYALQQIDTNTNIFPSIHVYNSVCAEVAILKSKHLKNNIFIRSSSMILTILICISTVTLKQHSVVDIFGALLMAWMLYPMFYEPNYSPELAKEY